MAAIVDLSTRMAAQMANKQTAQLRNSTQTTGRHETLPPTDRAFTSSPMSFHCRANGWRRQWRRRWRRCSFHVWPFLWASWTSEEVLLLLIWKRRGRMVRASRCSSRTYLQHPMYQESSGQQRNTSTYYVLLYCCRQDVFTFCVIENIEEQKRPSAGNNFWEQNQTWQQDQMLHDAEQIILWCRKTGQQQLELRHERGTSNRVNWKTTTRRRGTGNWEKHCRKPQRIGRCEGTTRKDTHSDKQTVGASKAKCKFWKVVERGGGGGNLEKKIEQEKEREKWERNLIREKYKGK